MQDLYVVIGGELKDVSGTEFRDVSKVHVVGVFSSHDEAVPVWRGAAQQTVDNALMRYFIRKVA